MSEASLRYVVLHHTGHGAPHFDLMLELARGAMLTTWRSPVWPLANQTPLTPLSDHRRDYLSYEGPVSGGRGQVKRVAEGNFELVSRGKTMLIVRFLTGGQAQEWLIADHPAGSVAVRATDSRDAE
jgi:hypothetical protein